MLLMNCAGVLEYPEDETIIPKAPLNVSAIRRLENMHQGEAAQEDNQAGNNEEFNRPPMQN